jgi:hypothetical protein
MIDEMLFQIVITPSGIRAVWVTEIAAQVLITFELFGNTSITNI